METAQGIVDSYLLELRKALQPDHFPARNEFFENIAEHIAVARSDLDPTDESALREVLVRLGDPRELAAIFLEDGELDEADDVAENSSWRHRAPQCVLALVLVLTAWGGLWWRHYQTLSTIPDVAGEAPSLVLTASGAHAATHPGDAVGFGNNPVWQEPAGKYSIDVVVRLWNSGSFPITIDHIDSPFSRLPGAGRPRISLSGNTYFDGGPVFHPFVLGAHETIFYSIHAPESCVPQPNGNDSMLAVSAVDVETTFLGYHRFVGIPTAMVALQLRNTCG